MNTQNILCLQRQIYLQVGHLNKFIKSNKPLKNVKKQKNQGNINVQPEPFSSNVNEIKKDINTSFQTKKNISTSYKSSQSTFTNKEFEELFENTDVQSQLNLSTKKNIKAKSDQHNINKGMLKLIENVVDELNIESDEKVITKNQLSNRYKVIQESVPVETRDFESLLGEIRSSEIGALSSSVNSSSTNDLLDVDSSVKINLNTDDRLGIFEKGDYSEDSNFPNSDQSSWSGIDWYKYYKLTNYQKFQESSKRCVALSGYDELISWTESKKLWKFPVNNEDCMPEEANVPFYEHVFFDDKLNEGNWCPKRGPIRDFMNCVTNALSLNPYLSVKEKHEHIEWFRDYFVERMETIQNLGLMQE